MKQSQTSKPKWTEVVIPDNFKQCDHKFEFIGQECKCAQCGQGLIGVYMLKNGKPVM